MHGAVYQGRSATLPGTARAFSEVSFKMPELRLRAAADPMLMHHFIWLVADGVYSFGPIHGSQNSCVQPSTTTCFGAVRRVSNGLLIRGSRP